MTRMTLALAALALLATSAAAQDWPNRTVRIIVPFAAGGAADTPARLYAEALSQAFGKQFVVENRPGGGGIPVACLSIGNWVDGAEAERASDTRGRLRVKRIRDGRPVATEAQEAR